LKTTHYHAKNVYFLVHGLSTWTQMGKLREMWFGRH